MSKKRIDKRLKEMEEGMLEDLTPEERAKLTLEAFAEGKQEEANRLKETCPKHTYKMKDVKYTNKLRGAYFIGSIVDQGMKESLLHMQIAIDKLDEEPKDFEELEPDEPISELGGFWQGLRIRSLTLANLQGLLLGFEEFCQEKIGIEPVKLLEAVSPQGAPLFKTLREECVNKELEYVDEEEKEKVKEDVQELFERTWEGTTM